MSKRPQRGNTCQQQQQQSERHEANVGLRELGQAPGTSENLDDHKQTMTSQTRKRSRLGQLEGGGGLPSAHATGERLDDESKTLAEQREMIEPAAKGELVQELRVSGRARCRTQQHNRSAQPALARSPPATLTQRPGPDVGEQPEAARRQSPRPLTAANPAGPKQNICAACKRPIRERYLLMALDKHWHEDCLKCACCDCRLGEVGSSLFTHSDKILCRRDFLRIFGQHGHCAACKRSIPPYELVMRANELAYHMDCFACQQCQYRFCVGDRFYLAEAHKIICLRCHSEQPLATPTAATATTAAAAAAAAATTTTTTTTTTPTSTTTTTTNSHFTYDQNQDQNHLKREPKCSATSTMSSSITATSAAAMGRLEPSELPPEVPSDAFDGRERVEAAKATAGANQLEGGAADQLDSECKLTPAQQQQVVAAAAAAANSLQPGDQKQACAV